MHRATSERDNGSSAPAAGTPCVLVVDDDPHDLLSLRAIIEPAGVAVETAASGEEALAYLLDHDCDLVLLDIAMPGLDGFETAQLIRDRKRSRAIPLIFLTGKLGLVDQAERAYALGAVDFVVKPVPADILLAKVKAVADLYHQKRLLEAQTERLRDQARLLDLSHDAIIVRDMAGRVRYWNLGAAARYGWSAAEAQGQDLHRLLHTRFPEPIADMERDLQTSGHWEGELEQTREDGSDIVVLARWALKVEEGGKPVAVLETCTDITARRDAERQTRLRNEDVLRTNRKLVEADRHKDEFLSTVSHELRTPLNFIVGFASILEDEVDGPLNERQKVAVSKILEGSDRMIKLVDDLLDMARIQSGKLRIYPEEADLGEVAAAVLDSAAPIAQSKDISFELQDDLRRSFAFDSDRIGQVIQNYVSNALKFTPGGGRIRIRLYGEGGDAVVEVSDTGIGIAAEDLPRLFRRFGRVEQKDGSLPQGTGLGLAISKGLIDAHGGRVGVLSQPGEGSTFWFRLPASW